MEPSEAYAFGELLRRFRVREGFSQQQLAASVGVSRNAVSAWERGEFLPKYAEKVERIAEVLYLNEEETDQLLAAAEFPPKYGGARTKVCHGFLRLDEVDGDGELFALDRTEMIIGRHPTCDLRVPLGYVLTSNRHARITCTHGAVYISDLDSKNHTYVEGRQVREMRKLEPGQYILLGGDQAFPGVCVLQFSTKELTTQSAVGNTMA